MTGSAEILLVEDNTDDLDMTLRALRKVTTVDRIHVARDGVEALDYLFCEGPHATRSISMAPKLVLLDLKLPRMDGFDVLRRLKSDTRTRGIPVVVLTSSREQNDVSASYALGVNSYIVKPVNYDSFVKTVSDLGLYWLLHNQSPS